MRTAHLISLLLISCRLTKQVSAFYSDVLRLLSSPPLNQHFDKSWTAHVQVKETLYDVESQLQQAAQLHKDDDIAPEIARLKVRGHNGLQLLADFYRSQWNIPEWACRLYSKCNR